MKAVDKFFSVGIISSDANYFDRGEVATLAGLKGLTIEERKSLLHEIMQKRIFKADGTKLVDDSKIELNLNAPNQDTVNTDAEAENVAMASDFLKIQEKLQSEDGVLEKMEKGIRSTLDYQNTETSEHCIICLENYGKGHFSCCGHALVLFCKLIFFCLIYS